MRKLPKQCPNCDDYMEPIFTEYMYRNVGGAGRQSNLNQEPESWKCMNCDVIFDVDDFGDLQQPN